MDFAVHRCGEAASDLRSARKEPGRIYEVRVRFVIVAWAFMLRLEAFGVTSIVRCFGLAPIEYYNLLHFFHSASFFVCALCCKWNEARFFLRRSRPMA